MSDRDPSSDAPPRVLVVDDEEPVIRAFTRTFGSRYRITGVTSGEAALRALAAGPFDVAVLDYSMPHMKGTELARRIEAAHPGVPCLMLTAYPDIEEILAARDEARLVAVLAKPWEEADVVLAVSRALRRREGGTP